MRLCIHHSITEIDPAAWNSIVPDNRLICRHEYLLAIERSSINNCRYYYPVIYEDDRLLAHTCLYVIQTELDLFAKGILKQIITGIRSFYNSFLIMTSLECGTPVALGNTLSWAPDADASVCLRLLVQESEKTARSLRIGVLLFRDFSDEDKDILQVLSACGLKKVRSLANTCMNIQPWSSYEDYLASLRSTYRYKIQRRTKTFIHSGVTIEFLDHFSEYAGDLARLWKNAYDHAREYRREFLNEDFFRNIDTYLGSRSIVILMRDKNLPVAFALLLEQGPILDWVFCGMDYASNEKHALYFNLLYQITRYGIEHGFKHIHYGVTTLIPKMDIGASTVPLCMLMKHMNSTLNRVLPACFDRMADIEIPSPRHVFRENSRDD